MRVVVISKYIQHEDSIRNQLSEISEKDSIAFFYSYSSAQDFIQGHIEKHQEPLDLIIIYNGVNYEDGNDFNLWLNTDETRTYSKRDFNLREIPRILIASPDENKNSFSGYDATIDDLGYDKLHLFISDLALPVKRWRSKVLDEMDNLGIRFNSGVIDYSYYFYNKRIREISTRILSEGFKKFPRPLNYYWLSINTNQIQKSIDDFLKLLKRTERLGKKREEKLYQKFFNENKYFLLRDNYAKYWYEPKLEKGNNKFEEPDFTLKPNFTINTDLSLLEIKLPNEGFIKNKKYHKSPLSNLVNHIIQVNDYKDYLESQEYKEAINKVYGYVPNKIEYSLLIGRKQDKLDKLDELNKVMRQLGNSNLLLLTYDELMDYQVKFLDRIGLLDIK
jgi:hypothetical protein